MLKTHKVLTKNKNYNKYGYLKLKKQLSLKLIKEIKNDISSLKTKFIYKDRFGKIRRIENITKKTKNLKKLNQIIMKKIHTKFGKKLKIFKDKCNFKPPGGAGFDAHYDGIFYFKNKRNIKKEGWNEYSNFFINALIPLDKCNKKNGALEIAKWHNKEFKDLIKNTNNDGSPMIKKSIEKKLSFKRIDLSLGDILFFSNKCPHRSKKNLSKTSRMILYYTYSKSNTDNYKKYFKHKMESRNKNSKSLTG